MTLSTRDRRAIILGGLGLLIIFAGYFALVPWINSWSSARAQITEARGQLDEVQRRVRRILGLRRRLEQIYGPAVNEPLEQDVQTAQLKLLETVKETFSAGGFKPSEYRLQRPRPLSAVPDVQIVPLEVPGQCNLSQLVKSLAGLCKAKTFVFVERLSITNDEKKPGTFKITMVVATLARMPKARS